MGFSFEFFYFLQMGDFTHIRLEKKGEVAEVIFSRPNKLNSMTLAFFDEIEQVFKAIDNDTSVRAAIVWAEGKIFTAGLDLKEASSSLLSPSEDASRAVQSLEVYKHVKSLQNALNQIRICRKPVIAAIHGDCIGGGVDLVTACDIRLCSADANFVVKETKLAIVADLGTLQRLPKLIGKGLAREMCLTGEKVDAQRALRYHLVNEVYANKEQLLEKARSLAATIASNSPLVVQATKLVLNYAEEHSIADGLEHIALFNSAFLLSDDLQEALMSFMEKRKPIFRNNL